MGEPLQIVARRLRGSIAQHPAIVNPLGGTRVGGAGTSVQNRGPFVPRQTGTRRPMRGPCSAGQMTGCWWSVGAGSILHIQTNPIGRKKVVAEPRSRSAYVQPSSCDRSVMNITLPGERACGLTSRHGGIPPTSRSVPKPFRNSCWTRPGGRLLGGFRHLGDRQVQRAQPR